MSSLFIKYNYLKILFTGLFFIGIFVVPFSFAHALTISPARVELGGNPGQTLTGEYILINEQNVTKIFYSSFENFEAQGETGTPNFVAGDEGLAKWIDSSSKIVMAPHETKKLQYAITIPMNADPGGHFAAIFWGTSNPEEIDKENGEVFVGAKIGLLILLRVSGDIEEGGGILSFETLNEDEQESSKQKFFTTLPVDFYYRFQNIGDDRIKPKGAVTIKNMFGMQTNILGANHQDGNILPNSVRKFKLSWNGVDNTSGKVERLKRPVGFISTVKYQVRHFAFGMYTAHLELTYGTENEIEDNAKTRFFVFSWQLLIVVLLGLFVITLLMKGYNKMIIKRAEKMNNVSSNKISEDTPTDSETQQSKDE